MRHFYISRLPAGEGDVLAERGGMIYGPRRMAITRADVLHVAALAHLELDPVELERLEADLRRIVEYVDELAQVDTRDVPPTAHVAVAYSPLRSDQVSPGLDHEAALAEAPRARAGAFAVPAFLDDT